MSLNIALLLAAISAVESGDNDLKIGRAKEISRYQMLPAVWMKYQIYGNEPRKYEYQNPAFAGRRAETHIHFLISQLPADKKDDPGAIILSWKKGPTGAKRLSYNANLAKPKTQSYCERVWNTYQDKLRQ